MTETALDHSITALRKAPAGWHARMATLAQELEIQGRGLHTGRKVNLCILPSEPAEPFKGVLFRRKQGGHTVAEAHVSPFRWVEHPLCSSLRLGDAIFARTVEHLLAALLMCEIDAAVVEMDAEEVPILDASALEWVRLIAACGRKEFDRPKLFIKVLKKFTATFPKSRYTIEPGNSYHIHGVTHEHDFARMEWQSAVTPDVFANEIAAARSFGHLRRIFPALLANVFMKQPLLRGIFHTPGALICNGRVRGGMRIADEFVRHRILDFIGDFAFLGAPVLGHILAHKPAHKWNHLCMQQLLQTKDAWCWASV